MCIKARWADCIPLALGFVTEQGRMKFVRPIYKYVVTSYVIGLFFTSN